MRCWHCGTSLAEAASASRCGLSVDWLISTGPWGQEAGQDMWGVRVWCWGLRGMGGRRFQNAPFSALPLLPYVDTLNTSARVAEQVLL